MATVDRIRLTRRVILTALPWLLLFLALARLGFYVADFTRSSLQMDFAAYYTAGEALNRNLSLYQNHVAASPPLWDGVASYMHSRFLYPPLTAYLFSPLASLSYSTAKTVWTLLGMVCIGASLAIAAWIVGADRIKPSGWALIGAATAFFHPLLTHLERGQIDSLTLLILMASFALQLKGQRGWHHWSAGMLLGAATLLKLHVGLILPFLVVRRRFTVTIGYAASLALLVLSSLLVTPEASMDYVTHQLPRISRYGESGEADMRLPSEPLDRLLAGIPEGMTHKGGRVYQRESFSFFANATLVRYLMPYFVKWGIRLSLSQVSLGIFVVLFGALFLWQSVWCPNHRNLAPPADLLYWQLVLIIILLSAPQTWVMNVIWVLPLCVALVADLPRMRAPLPGLYGFVAVAGLTLAGTPDRLISMVSLAGRHIPWQWASHKYLVALGLLSVALIGYLTVTDVVDCAGIPHKGGV